MREILEYLKGHNFEVVGIASSVQRLASGWTVQGSNPGVCKVSREIQTGPETHPLSCRMDTGAFRGAKQQAHCADQPPSYNAELQMCRSFPYVTAQTYHGVTFTLTYRRLQLGQRNDWYMGQSTDEQWSSSYRCADKFLARPGRKQATATEDLDIHISYL